MAAEEGDAAMALLDQVAGGQVSALLVVQGEEIPVTALELAVEQQHVGVTHGLAHFGGIAAFGRRQDQAGRGVFHQRGQHRLLPHRRFTGAAQQGHVALRAKRLVYTGSEFGEERVGQVVDDQCHAGRGPPAQVGCAPVVHITLPAQFGFHPRAGVDIDQRAAPQHQRHRGARHADGIGDVGYGDRTCGTGTGRAGAGSLGSGSVLFHRGVGVLMVLQA